MSNKRPIHELSIFGGYKKLEDQATAALLHILDMGGPHMVEYVFEDALAKENNNTGYTISAQPYYGSSRPDGEILANYHLVIESKIDDWGVNEKHNKEQLTNHLKNAQKEGFSLLYILNQQNIPIDIANSACLTINWDEVIFRLNEFIKQHTFFNKELMFYLIEQLHILIKSKIHKPNSWRSIPQSQRVVVVGGSWGEEVALNYGFYACQYNRKFQSPSYITFYHQKRIKYVFRIIARYCIDSFEQVVEKYNFDFKDYFKNKEPDYLNKSKEDKKRQFFILELEHKFAPEIRHEEAYAYVQRQRYTSIEALMSAKTTSDL